MAHRGGLSGGVSRLVVGAAVVIAAVVAGPVLGQMRIWAGQGRLPITTSELDEMYKMLELDEFQQEAISGLHEAFVADFERAQEEMRTIQRAVEREFERQADVEIFKDMGRKATAFERYKERKRDRLYEDMKLLLSEEQVEEWPRFERYQRRIRAGGDDFDQVSGSWVDLVLVFEQLELSDEERESAEPIVLQYELALDRIIIEQNKIEKKMSEDMLDEFSGMDDMDGLMKNMAAFQKLMKINREMSIKSRDLHASWMPQIVSVLPEEQGRKFEREYLRQAYPRVYEDGDGHEAFREIDKWQREQLEAGEAGLSAEDLARVEELREAYVAECESINRKWVKAIQRAEEKKKGLFFMPSKEDPVMEKARESREEIDKRYIDELAQFLPEDVVKELPEREDAVDWRRMGNFDQWE